MTFVSTKILVVVALGVAGAAWDVSKRRVPNALTFGATGLAFLCLAMHDGPAGLLTSVLGWTTGLVLFFPLFALGGMGGGDVKLLAAFGAWLGPVDAMWAAIWASLIGGGLALAVAVLHGYLGQAFRNVGSLIGVWRTMGLCPVPGLTLADARGVRLAYAVPIAAGAMVALWTA